MNIRNLSRGLFITGLLAAGAALAPVAMARSHVSIGVGIYGPGYSVGYNNCRGCYYTQPYYPAYSTGYYSSGYYAPAYYDYYPAPAYYQTYPVYGTVYYGGNYWRGNYRQGWRGNDHRWNGHRNDYRGRGDWRGHGDRDDH